MGACSSCCAGQPTCPSSSYSSRLFLPFFHTTSPRALICILTHTLTTLFSLFFYYLAHLRRLFFTRLLPPTSRHYLTPTPHTSQPNLRRLLILTTNTLDTPNRQTATVAVSMSPCSRRMSGKLSPTCCSTWRVSPPDISSLAFSLNNLLLLFSFFFMFALCLFLRDTHIHTHKQ